MRDPLLVRDVLAVVREDVPDAVNRPPAGSQSLRHTTTWIPVEEEFEDSGDKVHHCLAERVHLLRRHLVVVRDVLDRLAGLPQVGDGLDRDAVRGHNRESVTEPRVDHDGDGVRVLPQSQAGGKVAARLPAEVAEVVRNHLMDGDLAVAGSTEIPQPCSTKMSTPSVAIRLETRP